MYQWVKPQCVIPVHGEHRHMIEHINFAREMQVPHPVQVENGDIVKLYPGDKPEVYDKAPSGRLYLDGNVSVEEDSQSIKDRRNLSSNGYLEITILITPKGNIHNSPIITFRGLPVYEKEEFLYRLLLILWGSLNFYQINISKRFLSSFFFCELTTSNF